MPSARRRFDAVLFDFGGVLVASPFNAVVEAAGAAGHDPTVTLEVMFGPYHEDTDHPWHQLERGEVTLEEFIELVQALAAERNTAVGWDLLSALGESMIVREHMIELVHDVHGAGYGLALVTNNIAEGRGTWTKMLPVELFGAIVDSSAVGMRKPNPAIYHHTLELLGVAEPGRAVMVDDAPGNIEGARRAGLEAVLVEDAEEAEATLRALLEI